MDKFLEKWQLNTKKGIENLGIILLCIVIVMIVINTIWKEDTTHHQNLVNEPVVETTIVKEESFETKLCRILSSIGGVKNVSVMVSYENSIEKVPLYDTKEVTTITEESDRNGGERKTKEINNEYAIAYEENGNIKTALVKQTLMPKMIGVIVTCEGAENSVTKEKIIQAVEAVTGLSSSRIQVFAK